MTAGPDPRNARLKVWLDGQLVPRDQAKVSVLDAGFMSGDGVRETIRLHKGCLLFLDAHLDRLYDGARQIEIDLGLSRADLALALHTLIAANGMEHGALIRVTATRGLRPALDDDPRSLAGPATLVLVADYSEPSPALAAAGLRLVASAIRATPADMFDMRLNSLSRLNLIRALIDAIRQGGDEALMLDPKGHVSGCSAANLFWVKDGEVRTSTGRFCLNGVTRGTIIRLCDANGLAVKLGDFPLADILGAEEAFLTSTTGGVLPVREIDGSTLPLGVPGPMTAQLARLYEALKDEQAFYTKLRAGTP